MQSYPMCMSLNQEQLWVGDREGKLSLLDVTDGDFDVVQVNSCLSHSCVFYFSPNSNLNEISMGDTRIFAGLPKFCGLEF